MDGLPVRHTKRLFGTVPRTKRVDRPSFCEMIFSVLNVPFLMAPALEREVKSSGGHTNWG
jgi:hypothetical protein